MYRHGWWRKEFSFSFSFLLVEHGVRMYAINVVNLQIELLDWSKEPLMNECAFKCFFYIRI
jgi:hypothetical protein